MAAGDAYRRELLQERYNNEHQDLITQGRYDEANALWGQLFGTGYSDDEGNWIDTAQHDRVKYLSDGQPYMTISPEEASFYGNNVVNQNGQLYVPQNVWTQVVNQDYNQRHGGDFGNMLGDFLTTLPQTLAIAGLTAGAGGFLDPYSLTAADAAAAGTYSGGLLSGGAAASGTELMGPSALELGVPGATGYAAPALETAAAAIPSAVPDSYWNMLADSGGTVTDAAAANAGTFAAPTGVMTAADTAGLAQMAADAGLTGPAVDAFVGSGGILGSTSAGGLGGAATIAESFGLPTPAYTPPVYSAPAETGAFDMAGSTGTGLEAGMQPGPATVTDFTVGPGQTSANAAVAAGIGTEAPTGGITGSTALGRLLGLGQTGQDILSAAGPLLGAGLGYLGSQQQSNAITDIYNQTRADRSGALNAYNTALTNPNSYYQSAPAMGSVDAVLRKLSVQGNPAANPGLLSQAAAYNLGGYNDYLRALTPAAFGTAGTEANLGMGAASADRGGTTSIASGLGSLLTPSMDISQFLKQIGGNNQTALRIGGMRWNNG